VSKTRVLVVTIELFQRIRTHTTAVNKP